MASMTSGTSVMGEVYEVVCEPRVVLWCFPEESSGVSRGVRDGERSSLAGHCRSLGGLCCAVHNSPVQPASRLI